MFTLLEMLISISILGLIAAGGMAVSLNMYTGYLFKGEYMAAVRLLEQARSASITNKNQTAHGVRFEGNKYIVFKGSYDPSNQDNLVFSQGSELHPEQTSELIFQSPDGNSQNHQTIKLIDGEYGKTITISPSGILDW